MKSSLLRLLKSAISRSLPIRKAFNVQGFSSKKFCYSSISVVFITLFFLSISVDTKAQATDVSVFPLNQYLYTTSGSPYPVVNSAMLQQIDTSKFVNVMNYGAKGDGKTYDDKAIAAAFQAAQYGVIFPAGKVFLVSKLSTITLTHDLTVYAYGAIIKMAPFCKYSFLELQYQVGSYHNNVIWLGGTLNGNKSYQSWPGSPTGNSTWEEAHGRFVGVSFAEFVLFKDVAVINTVVDGIAIEASKLGVFSDCKASGGARLQYNQVQEQGTYFKFTRAGLKTCYFLNLTCNGGSIGTHVSYPENTVMDTATLSVHVNCHYYNQVQNAIHIEDCYKNFFYNCSIGADTGIQYHASIHLSNRTGIVSIKNCQFKNAKANFNQANGLRLGIVDSCQFVSGYTNINAPLSAFIEGRPTVCINSTFSGKTATRYQAYLKNVRNCTFANFDSLAIQGGYAIDGCTFNNGINPANLAKYGFVLTSVFKNVQNTIYNSKPASNDWKNVYLSYIDIVSDGGVYLGRISCGSVSGSSSADTLKTNQLTTATAMGAASGRFMQGFAAGGAQHQTVPGTEAMAGKEALSAAAAQKISLYPNPAAEMLHVNLNGAVMGKTVLNIYDQQGRLVQSKTIYKQTQVSSESIAVSALGAGTYVLHIINEQQSSSASFIVGR